MPLVEEDEAAVGVVHNILNSISGIEEQIARIDHVSFASKNTTNVSESALLDTFEEFVRERPLKAKNESNLAFFPGLHDDSIRKTDLQSLKQKAMSFVKPNRSSRRNFSSRGGRGGRGSHSPFYHRYRGRGRGRGSHRGYSRGNYRNQQNYSGNIRFQPYAKQSRPDTSKQSNRV